MPRRRRSSFGLLRLLPVLLLIVVVAGMVGAVNGSQSEKWDQLTRDDLRRMHRDLAESITLLRGSGFEITAKDVTGWLRHLDTGGYLAGGSTSMRLLRHDPEAGRFLVVAHGTWHNALTESTDTGEACGRLSLTRDVRAPLDLADVPCPEGVEPPLGWVPPPCSVGGCAGDQTLLAKTVLRVQRARWTTPVGSPVRLSPTPAPTRPVGNLRRDSTAIRCAPGTRDLTTRAAYVEGKQVPVRLCAIPGLPSSGAESIRDSAFYVPGAQGHAIVNARVSGAALALVRAARHEGVDLTATSSFRTMRHQRELCRTDIGCRTGNYTLVAPPGYSQHQLGVALDFVGTRVTGHRSCERRAADPASRVWQFLSDNAGRFGFRQYAAESWHWDALPAPDRCDRTD